MKKFFEKWKLDALYVPLVTAYPAGLWLLLGSTEWHATTLTLYILCILFLSFSGFVETGGDSGKEIFFGYVYLTGALFFSAAGLWMWLI
ncbi:MULTISPECIES: hypothetical protein [Salimicrobium]|uniref:Uncharacterized protein n=2 Tax=Salimicrobium TaxID=351195 RepID=A0ABY1KWB7_9BACI|nr:MULTISPECIES: hypothetical protein [Salimicrobium]SDY15408.1 hypothetical protein SAMN04488081_2233 [Salimicrobium album]SIS77916.1 hypothetical protein SAMN05421758_105216 [Salimicrobium salexigens]